MLASDIESVEVQLVQAYGLRAAVLMVTPELAREWLETMGPNRKLRPSAVKTLSADINGGHWVLNGQPFRFNEEEQLIDGQHRAQAIIASGRSVPSLVVWGVREEATETIDAGLARSFGDLLQMRGEKYHAHLAGATASLHRWDAGHFFATEAIRGSILTLSRVLEAHPTLREAVAWANGTTGKMAPVPGGQLAFFWVLFGRINATMRDAFFTGLATGESLPAGHPTLILRNQLLAASASRFGRPPAPKRAAWIIKAWNAYRQGDQVKLIKWSPWVEEPPLPV